MIFVFYQPDQFRWLADILVKSIAACFYGPASGVYGLAMNAQTANLFEELKEGAILFIATGICHAIGEYASGAKRTDKFEGVTAEGEHARMTLLKRRLTKESLPAVYARLRNTWYSQRPKRQRANLRMLLKRVRRQVGWDKRLTQDTVKTIVHDPYAKSIEDLRALSDYEDSDRDDGEIQVLDNDNGHSILIEDTMEPDEDSDDGGGQSDGEAAGEEF